MHAFTCHLESIDSVRTSQSEDNTYADRRFHRLFAETFAHLLFGEQIRCGQIPLLDSFGWVQVVAELLDARQTAEEEQGGAGINHRHTFLPVVMTHYPQLGPGEAFSSTDRVFIETLVSRLNSDWFEFSSMPSLGDSRLRAELSKHIQNSGVIDVPHLSSPLIDELGDAASHLDRLATIEHYLRQHQGIVQENNLSRKIDWKNVLASALEHEPIPDRDELFPIFDFYKDVIQDNLIENRSHFYEASSKRFPDSAQEREVSRELVDSLYMWNEAQLTGAATETTSSGVEGDNHTRELGETINSWADNAKKYASSQESVVALRPVLQHGPSESLNALRDPEYRQHVLVSLARLLTDPSYAEFRKRALSECRWDQPQAIRDYWQTVMQHIQDRSDLSSLVSVAINQDGIIQLCIRNHAIATKAPGLACDPSTQDQIRESMQPDPNDLASNGSNMPTLP